MAKLEDLRAFDSHLKQAREELDSIKYETGVWSEKQQEKFRQVHVAMVHLVNAVSELVARNR